ncbi:MFS transporter [Algoriphagus machipongonensis]|uniref:MFS transporter n=1 Tax=Algoriphagus machipongonensis TaxID=388413 RepID=UPI0002F51F2D|nr:MFS transporter [Algoriphagus machipongonensis]
MRKLLLLLVIYLAFISLGLPDALLGSAWPAMIDYLNVPADFAGIISMIVGSGTVISSLFSGYFLEKFGEAKVTTFSVILTALALMGFSYSQHFFFLCLLAVPLGLGAGSVDAALNNYVAIHYQAKHMNWLHAFWGVGAAIGPIIMASYLAKNGAWTEGYNTIAWIQFGLVAILILSLPLWEREQAVNDPNEKSHSKNLVTLIRTIPGLKQALLVFFCYCTIEASFGLWGASFLVFEKGFEADQAARLVSLYYIGITVGRLFSGYLTNYFTNRQLIYCGQGIIAIGLVLLSTPFTSMLIPGFILVGLGCAPIFPSLLHETPINFGEKYSQKIMGMQMASAYVGILLMPFVYGKISTLTGYSTLVGFLGIFLLVLILMNKALNTRVKKN